MKARINKTSIMFNMSQNEYELELQEEPGIEGMQEMAVDDSCDDQMAKVRLIGIYY